LRIAEVSSTPDRINWSILGLTRFMLASIVACSHIIYFSDDGWVSAAASLGSKSAVVGFLLVSGFSIAASLSRDRNHFYWRRFKRIYPIYLFAIIVGIGLEIHFGSFQAPHNTFEATGSISAIGNVFLLQTFLVKSIGLNPVVWSLAVEVSFYVVAPFLIDNISTILAMCAVSLLFYAMPHVDRGFIYNAALKANAIKYFWPFGFGLLLYRFSQSSNFLLAAMLGAGFVWASDINYERFAVLTYLGSVMALFLSVNLPFFRSRVMDYLGDLSYPLYLVQVPSLIIAYSLTLTTSAALLSVFVALATIASYELIDVRLKRILFRARRPEQLSTLGRLF
jgi:peptidoglycan/LPS O-acetylase OafA/YrhL